MRVFRMNVRTAFVLLGSLALVGCQKSQPGTEASIEFTRIPPAAEGGPDKLHEIAGRVQGAKPGQQIVLFARSGIWWVQPTAAEPFTAIDQESNWRGTTHPGGTYAALLVNEGYHPAPRLDALPEKGGDVVAIATAEGSLPPSPLARALDFGGYPWELREVASDRGGTRNVYEPSNVWTDVHGHLHLRIAKKATQWTSAEVNLGHSLGYGTYRFVVRGLSDLEPAAVFSIFTWDESGPPREMDIEVSRWGEPEGKNAQYVIQPYYVPANAKRFTLPSGPITFTMRWEPGRISFRTERGRLPEGRANELVSEHVFTSGVPTPGNETIHMNLYVFENRTQPLQEGCEVIVEKFEYLP